MFCFCLFCSHVCVLHVCFRLFVSLLVFRGCFLFLSCLFSLLSSFHVCALFARVCVFLCLSVSCFICLFIACNMIRVHATAAVDKTIETRTKQNKTQKTVKMKIRTIRRTNKKKTKAERQKRQQTNERPNKYEGKVERNDTPPVCAAACVLLCVSSVLFFLSSLSLCLFFSLFMSSLFGVLSVLLLSLFCLLSSCFVSFGYVVFVSSLPALPRVLNSVGTTLDKSICFSEEIGAYKVI